MEKQFYLLMILVVTLTENHLLNFDLTSCIASKICVLVSAKRNHKGNKNSRVYKFNTAL